MSTTYANALSSTGTCTLARTGTPGVTWGLTYCEVSFAGPSRGPNARITIYDGSAATGEIIYRAFLDQPTGSVGIVQLINIPIDQRGNKILQALTGNAMTIVVDGFGANLCSINARFADGLP